MLIEAGYDITFQCPAQTPMLLQLNIHPTRVGDLRSPDIIYSDPSYAMRAYLDHYGNRVTRVEVPAGLVTFHNRFRIHDSGRPDEIPPDAELTPIARLPDEVLLYLVSSRYCDSDNLADFAWSKFHTITGGWRRAQAICDFVHAQIRFSYPEARPTRTASDAMREGVGVCRDFAHLAVAFCRCLNIPARYVNGHMGDIGVPVVDPMDFSAWIEVFLEGSWWTFDPRNNIPRIGRIVVARGRDAADIPLINSFGPHILKSFRVWTYEVTEQQATASDA
jgi:transglutaminase-like putative cysteine protease